jgi:hypothetical protein
MLASGIAQIDIVAGNNIVRNWRPQIVTSNPNANLRLLLPLRFPFRPSHAPHAFFIPSCICCGVRSCTWWPIDH